MHTDRSTELSEQLSVDPDDLMRAQPLGASHPCRVLIVDDDDLVRARLSALLRASHYQVEVAATGEDALRVLNATHCHIVLTDWHMPDMDGLALCRHVRLRVQESYIYVMMLTIRDTEIDMLTGFAAGADDYVVKGATIDEILARLEIGRRIAYREYSLRKSDHGKQGISYTDPVTGAYNLGYLVRHLPRELARSQRYGHALAVLNCEIDGIGEVSDQFGHEAGDQLLRAFVACSDGCIRKGDWLARSGGGEFMIVLPETTAKGAHRVAEKLSQLYARHPLYTPSEPIGFTVNIGVTAVDVNHDPDSLLRINALIRAANRGGYAASRGDDHRAADQAMIWLSGSSPRTGAKNELN
jgi:two-component system, cell cycle response regulator